MRLEQNGHPRASVDSREISPGYRQFAVPDAVSGVFAARWQRGDTPQHPAINIRPDNCADIIVSSLGRAWVVGPATTVLESTARPGEDLRALRISTAAVGAITGGHAADLVDSTASVDELFSSRVARDLTAALWDLGPDAGRLARHCRRIWPVLRLDPVVVRAVAVLGSDGAIRMSALAAELSTSPRQLRRLVVAETGLSPKTIQRVARVRRATAALIAGDASREGPSEGLLAKVACATGFADQAHLTREMVRVNGIRPSEALRRAGS